jgi:hypothetical protein
LQALQVACTHGKKRDSKGNIDLSKRTFLAVMNRATLTVWRALYHDFLLANIAAEYLR